MREGQRVRHVRATLLRWGEVDDQLRQLTERFDQILEISPTAIVFVDLDNRIASWNPAAERLFGYSAEEAAGRDLDDLVASTDALHAEAVQFRQRVAANKHVQTISRRTRKDGSIVDVEPLAAPLVVDGDRRDVRHLPRHHRAQPPTTILRGSPRVSPGGDRHDEPERRLSSSWNPRPSGCSATRRRRPSARHRDLAFPAIGRRAEGKRSTVAYECSHGALRHPAHPQGRIAGRRRRRGRTVDVGGELVASTSSTTTSASCRNRSATSSRSLRSRRPPSWSPTSSPGSCHGIPARSGLSVLRRRGRRWPPGRPGSHGRISMKRPCGSARWRNE